MGALGIPSNKNSKSLRNDVYFKYKSGHFTNVDAVENLICYITRSRKNETRLDSLKAVGGAGVAYYLGAEAIIQQICFVQNVYRIDNRGGRRMYHEVFNLLDEEVECFKWNKEGVLWSIGMECCQVYFQQGFQAAFAVHWEPNKHWHFHFAVNTINFHTGRKWHTNMAEIHKRAELFNQIIDKYQRIERSKRIVPISFIGDEKNSMEEIDRLCE